MKNPHITAAQYHAIVATLLADAATEASIPEATARELAAANRAVATLHLSKNGKNGPLTHTVQTAIHHADAILDGDVSSAAILRTLSAHTTRLSESIAAETGWVLEPTFASVNAAGHIKALFNDASA